MDETKTIKKVNHDIPQAEMEAFRERWHNQAVGIDSLQRTETGVPPKRSSLCIIAEIMANRLIDNFAELTGMPTETE